MTDPQEVKTIDPIVQNACDVAAGRVSENEDDSGTKVIGACKDLNVKGNGPHWYRMVYRKARWRYVSDERLPQGSFRAAERRAKVYGEVFPGEITVDHDYGGQVDDACLVIAPNPDGCLLEIKFSRNRKGELVFILPDGSKVVLPDPRKGSRS